MTDRGLRSPCVAWCAFCASQTLRSGALCAFDPFPGCFGFGLWKVFGLSIVGNCGRGGVVRWRCGVCDVGNGGNHHR